MPSGPSDEGGIVSVADAFLRASETGEDLVLLAENPEAPVCRVMNYGKHLYERNKRTKDQRKKQHAQKNKEIKFHANIDPHDYSIKLGRMKDFLKKGFRVKVSLFFRGREMAHRELGMELMTRVVSDIRGFGTVDNPPRLLGRSITMLLVPESTRESK